MSEEVPSNPAPVTVEQLDQWVKELREQREKCDVMASELSEQNMKKARLEAQIAVALKELGRDNYQTPEGTFYFMRKWRFNLPPEGVMKTLFIQWLKDRGIAERYLTVNSTSYNSLLNQEREAALREGRLLDVPGVPAPQMFETVGFRKGKA